MGSFNVACSISNISINCGTKIAFLPLLPSEMNETIGRKYNKFKLRPGYVFLEPSANWVSNEGAFQFYKPFSLPIFGTYNDYGGIENVEENFTTKAIQEYFGISIEEFVDCIGNGRGDYDYFSPIFGSYFEVDKKLLSDYSTQFNEQWLLNIGFTKIENNLFQFKEQSYFISLFEVEEDKKNHRQAGFGYEILAAKDKKILKKNADTYDNRKAFLNTYLEISGYHVGYKEEAQEKINILRKMSGMFIHYDIYSFMTRNSFSEYSSKTNAGSWEEDADLNEDTLRKLGFTLRCVDDTIERYSKVYEYPGVTQYVIHCDGTWSHITKTSDKHINGNPKQKHYVDYSVFHPSSLIKAWKELTGIEIIIPDSIRKESKFGASFDQIREQYLKFASEEEDEDTKEINRKSLEKAQFLKTNPEELKKEVEALRADESRFSIFKTLWALTKSIEGDMSDEDDEDDEFDEDEAEKKEFTDEEIGKSIIKGLEERFVRFRRHTNPLEKPEGHIYLPLKPSYDKYNMLITLYEPYVRDGSIRQNVIDFCEFYWNCYAMNKMLMPAHNGYQFGCHSATFHLAKKTMEIMEATMKNYEEEEEEV